MELDDYKKHWKKKTAGSFTMSEANRSLIIVQLNKGTKKNTSGLLAIALVCGMGIGFINRYQHPLANFWVDVLSYITIPILLILCVTSAWLFLKLNALTPSEKNTKDYLAYINKKMKQTKAFMHFVYMPLLPVVFVSFMFSVMNGFNLSQKQIETTILYFAIFVCLWWIVGFSFLFNKLIEKHEYNMFQKEVESQLAALE